MSWKLAVMARHLDKIDRYYAQPHHYTQHLNGYCLDYEDTIDS
jgi:hypothetical protein